MCLVVCEWGVYFLFLLENYDVKWIDVVGIGCVFVGWLLDCVML